MRSFTKILLLMLALLILARYGRFLILLSLKFWLIFAVLILFVYLYRKLFKKTPSEKSKSDLKDEIKNTKWTIEDDEDEN